MASKLTESSSTHSIETDLFPITHHYGSPVIAALEHNPNWPDLPDAADSLVGALARRWLKDGDWGAARVLPDALADSGRDADAREVRRAIALLAAQRFGMGGKEDGMTYLITSSDHWRSVAMRVLWFDLFDYDATVAKLEDSSHG